MMKLIDYIHFLVYKNTRQYITRYIGYWIVFYMGIVYWMLLLIVGSEVLGGIYSVIIFGVLALIEVLTMNWIYTIKDRESDAIARFYNDHPSRLKMIFHLILFFILPFLIGGGLLPITKWVGENGGSLIKMIFG